MSNEQLKSPDTQPVKAYCSAYVDTLYANLGEPALGAALPVDSNVTLWFDRQQLIDYLDPQKHENAEVPRLLQIQISDLKFDNWKYLKHMIGEELTGSLKHLVRTAKQKDFSDLGLDEPREFDIGIAIAETYVEAEFEVPPMTADGFETAVSQVDITAINYALAESYGWHEKRERITHCTSCGKEFEPVFDDKNRPDHEQWENALEIEFSGGYGMFIDPMRDERRAIICHECAHDLCDTIKWIGKLLNPLKSHSHRYQRRLPDGSIEEIDWGDHKGWDLPHKKLEEK